MVKETSAGTAWGVSLVCGLFVGCLDSNIEPVALTLLLLIICGVALGARWPEGAWRWAVALAAGLFLFHATELLFNSKPRYPAEPNVFVTLFAVAPALIGVYGGVLARWMLEQARRRNV